MSTVQSSGPSSSKFEVRSSKLIEHHPRLIADPDRNQRRTDPENELDEEAHEWTGALLPFALDHDDPDAAGDGPADHARDFDAHPALELVGHDDENAHHCEPDDEVLQCEG